MIAPLFPSQVFERRRKKLLSTLRPNVDLIVIFNHSLKTRSHDTEYDYRSNSNLLYYSGFPEAESALILRKTVKSKAYNDESTLFLQPNDPVREHWEGQRYGPVLAKKTFGVTHTELISQFEEKVIEVLLQSPAGVAPRIYTNAFHDPESEEILLRILRKHRAKARKQTKPVEAIFDLEPLASAQRAIKGPEELKVLRKASKINVEAHLKVLESLRPGLYEYEVQAIVESHYLARGCRAPSYGSIVASGEGATILHYAANNRKMEKGELLLIDAGCEYAGYASDITRTLPISKKFSRAQRSIMDLVGEAHKEAIQQSVVGNTLEKIHKNTERCLAEGLKSLGILKGSMNRILEKQLHRKYFTHGTGHWLGMDVHDPNPYYNDKGEAIKLKPGMVFTVEPGLYFQTSDKSAPRTYKGIGVRIEDDVVVTTGKPEILTEGLPRYAVEIEKFMKG
jgi:Xaa-Pro aminopeptidase